MTVAPRLTRSHWPADTSVDVVETTAGDLLRRTAAAEPDRTALVEVPPPGPHPTLPEGSDGSRTWTYGELLADSRRAARWLLERFEPGERVAVWAPNIAEWVVLQYGAALAGLVLVTANPALRAGELQYLLRQSRSAGLASVSAFRGTDMAATVTEIRPRLPELREVLDLEGWLPEVRRLGDSDRPLPAVSPGDPAQLQYTSGTTGLPKGALLHHRGLITNARHVHLRAGFPDHGVWVTALPLFHTAGCGMSVLGCAASRGTLVMTQLFDPALVLHALQEWKADLFAGVPAMYAGLLNHPELDSYDLSSVTVTASGGDAVPADLIRQAEDRFRSRFSTVYGQTELSPIATQTSPEDAPKDRRDTAGTPLWGVELKIADPSDGAIVDPGEQGEICVRGYQLMLGYFELPDETGRTIDAEGWLHTGDLGVLDARGYLRVTGRLKDMIIRGGENIDPREVEEALRAHSGVADAAVLGIPDEGWGERVAAVVKAADGGSPPSAGQLHEHVRDLLAPHKTPKDWYLTSGFPANAMGKVQKFQLRRQISEGTLPTLTADPGSGRS